MNTYLSYAFKRPGDFCLGSVYETLPRYMRTNIAMAFSRVAPVSTRSRESTYDSVALVERDGAERAVQGETDVPEKDGVLESTSKGSVGY